MSDRTGIQWTDATWNPVTGCTKVSPGCAHCYIENTPPFRMKGIRFERGRIPVTLHPERLDMPLKWRQPRRVFVVSMGDLFHEDVPDSFLYDVFDVMAQASSHTFQALTKRPERMREFCSRMTFIDMSELPHLTAPGISFSPTGRYVDPRPLPNVMLGVSAENQEMADQRIPILLDTPAATRFVSCEPLLGPLDLRRLNLGVKETQGYGDRRIEWNALTGWESQYAPDAKPDAQPQAARSGPERRLDWVIVGGESGPKGRWLVDRCPTEEIRHTDDTCALCNGTGWRPKPEALEWLRSIRDQCQAAGVPLFVKQLGGPTPKAGGRMLDGRTWDEFPEREGVPACTG